MFRPLTPLDAASLKALPPSSLKEHARVFERCLPNESDSLSSWALLQQFLPVKKRRKILVWSVGPKLAGLVSLRQMAGPTAWEVEHLLLREDLLGDSIPFLEALCKTAGASGAEKLFLRVHQESSLLHVAAQAGFLCYQNETIYVRAKAVAPQAQGPYLPLRPTTAQDAYPLFRLYTAVFPQSVRCAEALTFQQWSAGRSLPWSSRNRQEWVLEEDGRLKGWLLAARRGGKGLLALTAHPDARGIEERLLTTGLGALGHRAQVRMFVPDHQPHLQALLESHGFAKAADFASLARQLTVVERGPRLVPVGA